MKLLKIVNNHHYGVTRHPWKQSNFRALLRKTSNQTCLIGTTRRRNQTLKISPKSTKQCPPPINLSRPIIKISPLLWTKLAFSFNSRCSNSNKCRLILNRKGKIKHLAHLLHNSYKRLETIRANIPPQYPKILAQIRQSQQTPIVEDLRTNNDFNTSQIICLNHSSQPQISQSCHTFSRLLSFSQPLCLQIKLLSSNSIRRDKSWRGQWEEILRFPWKSRMDLTVTVCQRLKQDLQIALKAHYSHCPRMPIWSQGFRLWIRALSRIRSTLICLSIQVELLKRLNDLSPWQIWNLNCLVRSRPLEIWRSNLSTTVGTQTQFQTRNSWSPTKISSSNNKPRNNNNSRGCGLALLSKRMELATIILEERVSKCSKLTMSIILTAS